MASSCLDLERFMWRKQMHGSSSKSINLYLSVYLKQNRELPPWSLVTDHMFMQKKRRFFFLPGYYSKWPCKNLYVVVLSEDNRAKWDHWKHFKAASLEHCVASHHAEESCMLSQAMEAGFAHTTNGLDHSYLLPIEEGLATAVLACTGVQWQRSHWPKWIAILFLHSFTETCAERDTEHERHALI